MITPNKAISLEASALGLSALILEHGPDPIELMRLYHNVSGSFESIDQFLLSIDVLYVLNRIEIDFQNGIVSYAN